MAAKWIAGIDFGTVRIGIALADPEVKIASAYENYTRRGPAADAKYFSRLAREQAVDRFVVGLPVHLDGRESQKSREAREFGAWLTEATGLPVEYFDERFTSFEAEQHLLDAGLTKKKRRERLDKLAAQIMLTAYLERTPRAAPADRADGELGLDDR
ncbi:MAG TPA: Holliday junction resolvase RuvX [Pirellulales bacterium]|nr:Holliday junction resolvase RuvX [Pirellulales bacterium]